MAKIYVVTEGSYSDYHICAVTVDKNAAERAAKICKCEVEEYDDFVDSDFWGIEKYLKDGYKFYTVHVKHGKVTYFTRYFPEMLSPTEIMPAMKTTVGYIENMKTYFVHCYARGEDHAKKIAFDSIAKYKAEKAGIC